MKTFRIAAIAAALVIVAPAAFAQNRTMRALNDKDQEMTTAIPKVQRAPRGKIGRMMRSERLRDHIQYQNDRTTGFAKQGPKVPRGMSPNPTRLDRFRDDTLGTRKDQELTTGIPVRGRR